MTAALEDARLELERAPGVAEPGTDEEVAPLSAEVIAGQLWRDDLSYVQNTRRVARLLAE